MANASLMNVNDTSKELSFLLFILQDGLEVNGQLTEEYTTNLDWTTFLQLSLHHRVHPLVYLKLMQARLDVAPADLMETLRKQYVSNTFLMLQLTKEMTRICNHLTDCGIRAMMLKGPVLAMQLYGDLSHRTSKDLDILVAAEDVELAEKVMLELGYEATDHEHKLNDNWRNKLHHISFEHRKLGVQVEIHWRFNPYSRDSHRFEELWERKKAVPIMNETFAGLGNEDLFYYLADHGSRHAWFRLRWLMDIVRLIPHVDGEGMRTYFKRYGGQAITGQASLLAFQLLAAKLPDDMKQLATDRKSRRLAKASLFFIKKMVKLNPMPEKSAVWPYFRYTLSLMSGRQKVNYMLTILYPNSKDRLLLPLYKPLHFLYFPLRPILWLWRNIKNI